MNDSSIQEQNVKLKAWLWEKTPSWLRKKYVSFFDYLKERPPLTKDSLQAYILLHADEYPELAELVNSGRDLGAVAKVYGYDALEDTLTHALTDQDLDELASDLEGDYWLDER